jgi:hypothetical protein
VAQFAFGAAVAPLVGVAGSGTGLPTALAILGSGACAGLTLRTLVGRQAAAPAAVTASDVA